MLWTWTIALLLAGCSGRSCSDSSPTTTASSASQGSSAPVSSAPSSVVPEPLAVSAPPVRYGVSALAHLPKGCKVAARIEWKALASHPLLSGYLKKALNPDAAEVATKEQRSFLDFLAQAKLDPQRDVDQVALCFEGQSDPLLIVAGALPQDVIELLRTFAPKGERYQLQTKEGIKLLTRKGSALTQADDRALVIGTTPQSVLAARQLGGAFAEYQLPETGEIAWVAEGAFVSGVFLATVPMPFGALLQRAQRVRSSFDLVSQELLIAAELLSAEEAEVLKTELSALLKALTEPAPNSALAQKAQMNQQLARKLLDSARWEVSDKTLSLRLTVPLAALALMFAGAK